MKRVGKPYLPDQVRKPDEKSIVGWEAAEQREVAQVEDETGTVVQRTPSEQNEPQD